MAAVLSTGTFRKNVKKTVDQKAAKLGLKQVAKNTNRALIARGVVSLSTHVGQVLQSLSTYLTGDTQLSADMRKAAALGLGDILADMASVATILKVKLPTSTKKVKLSGLTPAAALMELHSLTTDMLAIVSAAAFTRPPTTLEKKMVVIPSKGGAKEEREQPVINAAADLAAETERQAQLTVLLGHAVEALWRVHLEIAKDTPHVAMEAKMERLVAEFPGVEFEVESENPKESEAATAAAQ